MDVNSTKVLLTIFLKSFILCKVVKYSDQIYGAVTFNSARTAVMHSHNNRVSLDQNKKPVARW